MSTDQPQSRHEHFETDRADPTPQIVTTVAELKNTDQESLRPLWEVSGDLLDSLYDDPPQLGAQAEVSFTYEGYRVTINQDGSAHFIPVGE